MVEGALAELVGACTSGGVLTAWALYLELPPVLIGVLGALPFSAQLIHLPASWFTHRFGVVGLPSGRSGWRDSPCCRSPACPSSASTPA